MNLELASSEPKAASVVGADGGASALNAAEVYLASLGNDLSGRNMITSLNRAAKVINPAAPVEWRGRHRIQSGEPDLRRDGIAKARPQFIADERELFLTRTPTETGVTSLNSISRRYEGLVGTCSLSGNARHQILKL